MYKAWRRHITMPTNPKCFDEEYIGNVIAQELKKSGITEISISMHIALIRVYLRGAEEMQNEYTEIIKKLRKSI